MQLGNTLRRAPILSIVSQRSVRVRRFVSDNSKVILLVLAALFAFYWTQIRPVRIYRSCAVQASIDARNLLKSKAAITADLAQRQSYASMMEQNLYLRSDYESFFTKCLRFYAMGN